MTDNQTKTKDLCTSVLDRIEKENVCPRSKMFFKGRECVVWTLWLLTVVVGGLAVAVSLFVVTNRRYAFYEATHDNFFTFMVAVLPYVWLVTFAFMAWFAVVSLRKTKHGYRYPLRTILLSSLVFSFAAGSALQFFGLGYVIDKEFGRIMFTYPSQEKIELAMWQQPYEGRLVGKMHSPVGTATNTIWFEDVDGARWRVNIADLYEADHQVLSAREQVRLLGAMNTSTPEHFHACGAFPWMFKDKNPGTALMDKERKAFVERVYKHRDDAKARLIALETATFNREEKNGEENMGVCADLATARRIEQGMR